MIITDYQLRLEISEGSSPLDSSNTYPEYSNHDRQLKFLPSFDKSHYWGKQLLSNDIWKAKELLLGLLKVQHHHLFSEVTKFQMQQEKKAKIAKFDPLLLPTLSNTISSKKPNVLLIQKVLKLPFEVNIYLDKIFC